MRDLREIKNVSVLEKFNVDTGHHSVIQKGNVTKGNIYALQLWDNQRTIHVLRGSRAQDANCTKSIFVGTDLAGGHTQTWEYAGRGNDWFVGTKPKNFPNNLWDIQIARVTIGGKEITSNTNLKFPRLAHLNYAGKFKGIDMTRVEAAVSPGYHELLIASVDANGTGYFTIYDLKMIHDKLDEIANNSPQKRYVNVDSLPYKDSFKVYSFLGDGNSPTVITNSVQGYDIDDYGNIYVTSQLKPDIDSSNGNYIGVHHKQIVKIPKSSYHNLDECTDFSQWSTVNLSKCYKKPFDIPGYHSEVESIQITSENTGYLTVAYHAKKWDSRNRKYISYTYKNVIYSITW